MWVYEPLPGYGGESAEVRFKLADGATVEDVDGTRVVLGANGDAAALNAAAGEVLDASVKSTVKSTVSHRHDMLPNAERRRGVAIPISISQLIDGGVVEHARVEYKAGFAL